MRQLWTNVGSKTRIALAIAVLSVVGYATPAVGLAVTAFDTLITAVLEISEERVTQ